MRQLLKNAKVYDGTGSEPYQADILLEEDRIAKIAERIDLPADSVLDLQGKSVSPGFIDAHSHNDWFAIKKDPLPYFRPFILQYSHAIFVGRKTLKDKEELLKMFDKLRADGVDVMFDIYNECLGVSVITVILPAWYQGMTEKQRSNPLTRLKLAALVKATSLLLGFGFDDIQIAYIGPGYEKYEGKTVSQIAREEGTSNLKACLMLCEKSRFAGRVNMGPYSTPEIIRDFEHDDRCLYMTDAWVEDYGVQNPAIYDCYPKFLRDSLRGTGDTMAKTIRKMTGATADRFMLPDRGYLKEGYCADLTVFVEKALEEGIPDQEQPFGIDKVFINGSLVYSDNQLDEQALKTSGRAIPVLG